ncbi:MAG: hypothetical protein OET81_02585 [Desulfobacteraceae bacterium]|jgi:hypothetical protein|nr:hypothetical protein [Desulfobacterales bacterium]MDH3838105.1 hypothetical protein [Desulfobacteraceae bacterium]MDH3955555.1 hypothetical protein [Desulfobacteraceae bacterium]
MKKILMALILGLVFTAAYAQMDNPLKQGMPSTVTLSNGEVIYDLSGEWDAIYDNKEYGGKNEDIVKITQKGNEFVGIKLIGNQWKPVGSETIKGELDKDGFKSFYTSTVEGWTASDVKIDENCNRIEIETSLGGVILGLTLTRK